uniref:Uncharacterized protein n=2 Tax=Oryza sativa subsp. japonica TaxID=39947 RepID=Q8H8A8_ORYSJ|nr:Hypothetical protein [Oryza sativa Japonica Group]
MRIHPSPATTAGGSCGGKKDLRRLPHVYSKVLELPFPADTDVAVFEGPDAFHFVVSAAAALAGEVRVRTVRIHPGVVRVVVQAGGGGVHDDGDDDDMELDKWRSRLPEASCPAMAVAGYVNGQLVVTVPKGRGGGEVQGRAVSYAVFQTAFLEAKGRKLLNTENVFPTSADIEGID